MLYIFPENSTIRSEETEEQIFFRNREILRVITARKI